MAIFNFVRNQEIICNMLDTMSEVYKDAVSLLNPTKK